MSSAFRVLWAEPLRVCHRSPHFSGIFVESPSPVLAMGKELCLQVLPHSNEGLKGLLSPRKEGWAGRDQGNQWATKDFRASRWVWAGSNTPEWGEFLFWMCSWRSPGANLDCNIVERRVNTLIYWNYLSKPTRLGQSKGWRIISWWNNYIFARHWSWISAPTQLFLLTWL